MLLALRRESSADLSLPPIHSLSDGENSGNKNSRKKKKSKQANVTRMRAELQALLDKPLMMRGISGKYITTRGRVGFVDQLVEGTGKSSHVFCGRRDD